MADRLDEGGGLCMPVAGIATLVCVWLRTKEPPEMTILGFPKKG